MYESMSSGGVPRTASVVESRGSSFCRRARGGLKRGSFDSEYVRLLKDGDPETEHRHSQPRLTRDIGESTIAIIVVELGRRRSAVRMPRKIVAIHQQNVGITVIVVVDESAAGSHGFGQPFFSECSVVVSEMNSGLCGYIAKTDLLREAVCSGQKNHQPRSRKDTEKP